MLATLNIKNGIHLEAYMLLRHNVSLNSGDKEYKSFTHPEKCEAVQSVEQALTSSA